MKSFAPSHPMAIAWTVMQGKSSLSTLEPWPLVLRDTAISMVLDESLSDRPRSQAVSALSKLNDPIADETCKYVLEISNSSLMRQAAISERRPATLLLRRLQFDPSYVVRTKALVALPENTPIDDLRSVANDPHWRVRHGLMKIIEAKGLQESIATWNLTDREKGFVGYTKWRHSAAQGIRGHAIRPYEQVESPAVCGPFPWDSDPAVLLAELKGQPRQQWLGQLPHLMHHDADPIRKWAIGQLLEFGNAELCAEAAALATDPRHPGWWDVESLVRKLPSSRRPNWKPIEPLDHQWSAHHPAFRECTDPENETCWHVLKKYLSQYRSFAEPLLPEPRQSRSTDEQLHLSTREAQSARLAVSGHYLLPTEQFGQAFDAGIDNFFWESNYGTFNRFMKRLSKNDRSRLGIIAGTFEAEPRKIAKDVDRALRLLKVEQLSVFLLFWSRSNLRFTDETIQTLERLQSQGKLARYGLSTHQWKLATEKIESDWNPVMVRHNLAHRSAERIVFPVAREKNTRIISFNSTCYGRLIEAGISARDCLRYSLFQPEIDLVLTAPATAEQLSENLSVLGQPTPTPEEITAWQRVGDLVYEDNKAFQHGLRNL